ncbi:MULTISPECIES: sigma-70 family RNA polymerase sigma factor [Sphingosinicellaceae]|uniref:sigma-70 family RNA polymerase sigma factor n=1 Tax=Sphingosinicellaceae TaxID=2820280 RepID=UPI001D03186C|nr:MULTISPECIES: sigma-70 family RNA polymerase sigma factor [Polymorphobacter]
MSGTAGLVSMLDRIGAGDRNALKMLYEATSAKLFGVILRILLERGEAEDVLQEVYITVWRKAAEFDATRASPITWMVTIARNRAIDRLRARGSRPTTTLDDAAEVRDTAPGADVVIDAHNDAKRVNAALATLDPKHAAIIRSAYFEGLTYEAMSDREGVPIGTLKSWVRRGLMRMRTALEA